MCKFRNDPEQTSFLRHYSNQDYGRMPLTKQCKSNFIPLMLINKLLSEKSVHFSSLNVCDKCLIPLKMRRQILCSSFKQVKCKWLLMLIVNLTIYSAKVAFPGYSHYKASSTRLLPNHDQKEPANKQSKGMIIALQYERHMLYCL